MLLLGVSDLLFREIASTYFVLRTYMVDMFTGLVVQSMFVTLFFLVCKPPDVCPGMLI
jgi:hypothetical protein